jgi:hypothetical protein
MWNKFCLSREISKWIGLFGISWGFMFGIGEDGGYQGLPYGTKNPDFSTQLQNIWTMLF